LGNIYVHTDFSKFAFEAIHGVVTNPHNLTNATQKRNKRALVLELPREPRDTDPLIHFINSITKRVKERNPRDQHKVKTIDKPRAIAIDHTSTISIGKFDQSLFITNFNKEGLAFDK